MRMSQKQKRARKKERQYYRQKNKRGNLEKWDQTDGPKIPDRGETPETPRSPFGELGGGVGVGRCPGTRELA